LKKLIVYAEKCTGCGICEDVCSQAYFKVKDKAKSAIRVTVDDKSYRIEVCDQCGDCTKMCSPLAVTRANNGVVRITKEKCVGCLICVGECLRGFMHYHDDEPVPFKCIACGLCTKKCPSGALTIEE
jgi:Fe-S-cluster-containing hydrogenase component 2